MIKVLHINCNYFGSNPVHKTMIESMNNIKKIDNYVFSPVNNRIFEATNSKVVASNCIKKYDRLFFFNKSRKIRKSLLNTFDVSTFNIIHAYTLFTDGNVAYKLNEKYNIPYVVAIRNTDVNTFLKYMPHLRKRGIKIMQHAKAIFFLSNSYKELVLNKYIPQNIKNSILKKCHIIPNGINDFWLKNIYCNKENVEAKINRINKKNLKIVFAGNIDKNKNLVATCNAIELLQKEGWKINYIVAGKIKNDKIFKSIKNKIDYRGALTKEELLKIYREADIFVMPSFTETFGISYIEAISQGLPVIYTKNEGFDTQFKEGEVGYRVDPNNSEEIKDNIVKIASNYRIIPTNICLKIKKYSWDLISQEYFDIYNNVIGE